jgi:hypothetical protein
MPHLHLTPSPGAVSRKLAGFHSGGTLKLSFTAGETIGAVLHRFNEYRSPDNQIENLYTTVSLTKAISLQTPLTADFVAFVA